MREAGERLGHDRRRMHVHGPGQRRIARRAELHGRHEDDVGELGQRLHRPPIEQIAGDRLDARRSRARSRTAGIGEARDADDALVRRGPLGQARQRRPHLAGDAENDDVAGQRARDRRPAPGVGSVMKSSSAATLSKRSGRARRAHAAFSGKAGDKRAPRRRRHRPHGREVHVGGDGKARAGERAEREPPFSMRRRAGPPSGRRDRDGRGRRRPARARARTTCRR